MNTFNLRKNQFVLFQETAIGMATAMALALPLAVMAAPNPLDEPLPLVGTDANGHAYPGATVPFGMVQLSPDTGTEGWGLCSGYEYKDSNIEGFSHTHLGGTGC